MRRLLGLLLLTLSVYSAAPPPADSDKWTIDDVINQEAIGDVQLSPDGKFVVWVKATPDKDKNEAISHLFRTDLVRNKDVQLTRGNDSCSSPRWATDGAHLAFLSTRPAPKAKGDDKGKADDDPRAQIWLLDPTGGEPWPLTDLPRGVNRFAWANAETVVFTAQEEAGRRETVLKEDKKDTATVIEDDVNEPPVRLHRIDVKGKKVTRLTNNRDRIEQFAVSPDGKHVVAIHARSLRFVYDNKIKPIVVLHNIDSGTQRPIFASPTLNVSSVQWSPDGKGIYATHEHSSKPHLVQAGVTQLYYHDLAAGKETPLELDWPRGLATQDVNDGAPGVVPVADGFLALLADGVRLKVARYTRQGDRLTRAWLQGDHVRNLYAAQATRDGKTIVYAHSSASSPTQWYHARLDAGTLNEPRPMAVSDEALTKRRLARSEIVRWPGANNEEVDGILFYPHAWKPGQRAPLVVQIHGGPAAADRDVWEENWAYSANLVCQRGAFVLRPNYHGSAGYGQAWLESIADGKYCEPEIDDIEKGVDALIARGLVDANRLGLTGWSNGAILTNVLITRTTRYRAAVAGAGSIEYVSDWASCEFGEAFDRFYLGKSPLEDLGLYLRKSPFHRLDRVRTPTLLLFGAEDRVVHPQQGWAQYRAMQQFGKAPVRFVVFPGEKHSLKKLGHQRRKVEEEMAWLDRYLFRDEPAEDEMLKKDAPLAWLVKRQSARRVGKLYGVQHGTTLIPEVVRHGGCWIGRFEVTKAQYAAFNPNYRVEPGMENHPAHGISFDQAKSYCAWLSKLIGKRYRLPKESQAEELYDKPEAGDNTLDAWAGYAVNPEDAARLRERLKALPGNVALLKEVGSGRGVGKDELVYDLGGNVAEWVEGKDGKGMLRGGSADLPADAKGKGPEAGTNYRGFRVTLD